MKKLEDENRSLKERIKELEFTGGDDDILQLNQTLHQLKQDIQLQVSLYKIIHNTLLRKGHHRHPNSFRTKSTS